MSDPNIITAYSWAAGIFQQKLPASLTDAEKRAELVYEINTPLVKRKNGPSTDVLLKDLDIDDKNNRLKKIAQISMTYLTEQMDEKLRENILLRLWTGCIDAAKAIRFSSVAGIRNGVIIEAPITTQHRHISFQLIDLLAKTDLIYAAGVEVAPVYKKLIKQYYSFNGISSDSIVRNCLFKRIPVAMSQRGIILG
jgi:hypothetical protein